jgi:hypothetical protein
MRVDRGRKIHRPPLDFIPRNRLTSYVSDPPEGRSHETSGGRDRLRRPRAGLVPPHPGGPGQPSAGTKTGRLQWLDVAGTKGGGSRPDQGREERFRPAPGSTAPGTEKPLVARREAPRLRKKACTVGLAAPFRRAIPSHSSRGGRRKPDYGRTRRPPNNTGADACALFDNRIGKLG